MTLKTLSLWSMAALFSAMALDAMACDEISQQPGYVDFGDLSAVSANEPEVEVSLGGALLRFLSAAVANEDEELAGTLGKLCSIRISVFELQPEEFKDASARAIKIGDQLEASGWEPAVVVTTEDSVVRMYMKSNQGKVAGMTVIVVGPDGEAVFINIVGEIDPAQLGRVANKFGVSLDDLAKEAKD